MITSGTLAFPGSVTFEGMLSTFQANPWCVYEHYIADPNGPDGRTLIYIGTAPVSELLSMKDARNNTEWGKMVTADTYLYVRVIAFGERMDCVRAMSSEVNKRVPRPVCNLKGYNMTGLGRRVLCSNGQVYDSQGAAAKALSIPQGSISRNINGMARHAHGYTFSWAD
jgi:hypothetical protein